MSPSGAPLQLKHHQVHHNAAHTSGSVGNHYTDRVSAVPPFLAKESSAALRVTLRVDAVHWSVPQRAMQALFVGSRLAPKVSCLVSKQAMAAHHMNGARGNTLPGCEVVSVIAA